MFNRNCLATKLNMISKELLTAIRKDEHKVLNTDLNYLEEDNKIGYFLDNRHWYFINIYELAHRCKEWARDNEFFLRSFYDYEGAFCYISAPAWVDKIEISKTGFCSESEPEAIFQACEWILEQINKEK